VKKIVILGLLGLRQVDLIELDLDRPPIAIISPSTYNEKNGSLQGEADAICQENDRVDYKFGEFGFVQLRLFGEIEYSLSRTRPRYGRTQLPVPQGVVNGSFEGSYPARNSKF